MRRKARDRKGAGKKGSGSRKRGKVNQAWENERAGYIGNTVTGIRAGRNVRWWCWVSGGVDST